jgi:hypothetical protein
MLNPNISPQVPRHDLIDAELSTGINEIDINHTLLDPRQLGLRDSEGGQMNVPAVFEMKNEHGKVRQVALVRHERTTDEGQAIVTLALHGLRRARNGQLRARRRGVEFNMPFPEIGERKVTVGSGPDHVTEQQVFGRSRIGRRNPGFADTNEALEVVMTPQGRVFVNSTSEKPTVRMRAEAVRHPEKATGSVPVSWYDPIHSAYKTPDQLAEEREVIRGRVEKAQLEAEERRAVMEQIPRNYEGPVVTEESRAYSREWLRTTMKRVPSTATVIAKHLGAVNMDDAALNGVMDAIRTDAVLRDELRNVFEMRIERNLYAMGGNVASKAQFKHTSAPGYKRLDMYGSEYATLLALAHIDGTFDPSRESASPGEFNGYGFPILDQHRAAARFALDDMIPQQKLLGVGR